MIKVVVFDFDGTLVDSNSAKHDCLHSTVAPLPQGEAALAAALEVGGNRYKLFAEVARRIEGNEDRAALAAGLIQTYTRCCARSICSAPERRGARSALYELRRRGIRLWINSGTPENELRELVIRRGLLSHFRGTLGSPTPKSVNLRKIMRREGVTPGETVHVGDSPDDLVAAREAGTWFVAIDAEKRIDQPVRFAVSDLRLLPGMLRRFPASAASGFAGASRGVR